MKVLLFIIVLVSSPIGINAQSRDTSRLTGTIYDHQGAVIVNAKVTAKADGKVFNAITDENGIYMLTLPFVAYEPGKPNSKPARYDITVESNYFKKSETKRYTFVPSYTGRMSLDIALEVRRISDYVTITSQ